MIQLQNKKDCCGCESCVQRCPKHCIVMQEDEEGFSYPQINIELCINCGLCEKVCPVINQNDPRDPIGVYAAKNPNDEIRLQSSSGGIFTMLAEQIIDDGGVVFGVGYNKHWEAAHSYTETKEGLAAFRMSKYVQSIVGNTFKEAENFLKKGRKVLYSGTPCQIAGLKKYLRREYDNLLTVDFICHGTPSPGVFRWYLGEEIAKAAKKKDIKYRYNLTSIPKADDLAKEYGLEIKNIRFRDKTNGWKNFYFVLELSDSSIIKKKNSVLLSDTHNNVKDCLFKIFESKYENVYLKGFLRDLYLRPSCYSCPTKKFKSGSDITIADFWAINHFLPDENDHKGYSLLMIHSNKIDIEKLHAINIDDEQVYKSNVTIYKSPIETQTRESFFIECNKFPSKNLIYLINKYATVSFVKRIKLFIASLLKN